MGPRVFIALGVALAMIYYCNGDMSQKEKDSIRLGLDSGDKIFDKLSKLGDVKTSKVFNVLGKMSGFLGATAGLVAFIMIFLPQRDSKELTYMKTKFAQVNSKLDTITTELDNIKTLIVLQNQRAAYLPAASRILNGHKHLKNFFKELQMTKCVTAGQCKRVRARIASRYVRHFRVQPDLFKILHGVAKKTSVFGDPMLGLIKKSTKCNLVKMNQFTNGVLKLAFKAQQVILAHEKLTGSKISITISMNDWLKLIYSVRLYNYQLSKQCFNNIAAYMRADIRNIRYQSGTNAQANRNAKTFLQNKYSWLGFTVYSYQGYSGREHCTFGAYGGMWYMPPKNLRRRNLIVSIVDKFGLYKTQKWKVMNALDQIAKQVNFYKVRSDCCKILNKLLTELKKKSVYKFVTSLNVRKKSAGLNILSASMHFYISASYNLNGWYRGRRNRIRYKKTNVFIVVGLKSKEQATGNPCTLACKHNGVCVKKTFSSDHYCQCPKFYEGTLCESHSKAVLAKTMDAMLAVTLKLPVLSDIAFDIKDLRQYIGVSLSRMQVAISTLETTVHVKFNALSALITNQFKWANFITQYKSSIQKIEYFADLFELLKSIKDKKLLQIEGKKRAKAALDLIHGIRRPLFDFNKMLAGRANIFHHKPILIAFMKSKAGEPCVPKYKKAVNNYWKQLVTLQLLGYSVWSQALEFAGQPTVIVERLYKKRFNQQNAAIKRRTCQYTIANSANIRCTGGAYLPKTKTVTNRCNRNYYVAGSKTTTCVSKKSRCSPCGCNWYGSRSLQCAALNGRCQCKPGFYGTKCAKRNCVWGQWSGYGHCRRCGNTAYRQRTRSHAVAKFGLGRACLGASISYLKCYGFCCRHQFYCRNIRRCIHINYRCNYDNNCGDKSDERGCTETCYNGYSKLIHHHGGRNMFYLTATNAQCYGSVIQSFKLTNYVGGRTRYNLKCCRLLKPWICRTTYKITAWNSAGGGNPVFLDRQSVDCGVYAYLTRFQLQRWGGYVRYYFGCCNLSLHAHRVRTRCYTTQTGWNYDGNNNFRFLDRHFVKCNHKYFLTYFRLQRSVEKGWKWRPPRNSWRYNYRCCRIV